MRHEVDVLVIGAGPGGSTAAKVAAGNGAEVLMIEKRQEVGSPVRCGEGIAELWLNEIGIRPDRRWIANQVDGARLFSPSGHCLTMDAAHAGAETGFVVERDIFDRTLASEAVKAGADLWVRAMATGARVEGDTVKEVTVERLGEIATIVPKVVIAADGFESRAAGWVGLNSRIVPKDIDSCFQYRLVGIEDDVRYNDFYAGSFAPGGYVWVFSKGEGVANVGIGVSADRLKEPGEVKQYLDRFIEKHPGLSKGKAVDMVAGAVSTSLPMERTVKGNFLLVGDAARMVDALTGGGVVTACISGFKAGGVAAEFVEGGEGLDGYERAWRNELENGLIRNFVAKQKASQLDDETFDRIVLALQDLEITNITTAEILQSIAMKLPDLFEELEMLF